MSHSFVIPWIIAHQAPLSMDFPGNNAGGGCHFLLWGISPTQGSNLFLLHWQVDSLQLSHQESPKVVILITQLSPTPHQTLLPTIYRHRDTGSSVSKLTFVIRAYLEDRTGWECSAGPRVIKESLIWV